MLGKYYVVAKEPGAKRFSRVGHEGGFVVLVERIIFCTFFADKRDAEKLRDDIMAKAPGFVAEVRER